MDNVENLYERSLDELSNLLNAKNVVGEAVQTEHGTIIPLLSAGFGFGAGGGTGKEQGKEGSGGGAGAGGGIKPVAVIVVTPSEVRIERVGEGSIWERLAGVAARSLERRQQANQPDRTEEGSPTGASEGS